MKTILNIPEFKLEDSTEADLSTVQYFGFFSKKDIIKNAGCLLMLDIDFGRKCSLRCPTCFRRENVADDSESSDLSFGELLDVISDAKKLGLREIKICGAGEPFENPDLLRLARQLSDWDIGLSIFTKGHVLGDDTLVADVFAREGVKNAQHLAALLFELKTSILVSFQSFKPEVQDKLVGNIKGHTLRRNRAVEILVEAGFNKCRPTRLMLCALPITRENYEELFDIYVYCRKRNIVPLIAASMISGKQFNDNFISHIDVRDEQKIQLYTKIYEYNVKNGIQSLNTILSEGISAMPGIHPCNQIAAGLYITSNGNVLSCPGTTKIQGNVKKTSIEDIWENSSNFKLNGKFNCNCPAKDGKTLPRQFYSKVARNLLPIYSKASEETKHSGKTIFAH